MGILARMLHPNKGPPAMNFKGFIRAKAKGPITDTTLRLYDKDRQQVVGWLGSRTLDVETAQEAEAWLKSKFPKPNTLQRKVTALNWLLRWKEINYQARRPPKAVNAHPRVIAPEEYAGPLAGVRDLMQRVAVQIDHDAGWSPCDVVDIRRSEIDLTGPQAIVRHVRQKTNVSAEAILSPDTAADLRAYLEANPDLDFIFPGDRRKGCAHRNRTWLNAVLKRHGFAFSPRAFRSNLATRWPDTDIKGLQVQGGWKDTRAIFDHYKGNVRERQVASFETAMGHPPKAKESPDDIAGYG